MATKTKAKGKSAKKPSAKQLAARAKFAAAARARAGNSPKSSAKRAKKRPSAIKDNPKKPMSMKTFKLKKARKMKTRATRKYFSGPPSNSDDVSKVTLRTPNLMLAPIDESKFEIDVSGGYTKTGF